jgi:hypothetical protein
MDLTVSDYYDVCCWELTGEGGFEHLEEGLAFLPYQPMVAAQRLSLVVILDSDAEMTVEGMAA